MLVFAITFIGTALGLYTIAIWSEKLIKGGLRSWMVKIFASAFICDLVGTSLMFCQATVKFQFNFHSSCGYLALLIMGLHLFWAIMALKYHGRTEKYFHRLSLLAWFIWLVAFLSGIPRA